MLRTAPVVRGDHMRFAIRRSGGGAAGNRTPDLCSAIAALSHLSYSPVPARGVHGGRYPVNWLSAWLGAPTLRQALAIAISCIVGFIIIFGCAMALCFSAEKARETSKSRLTKRLVAVKAADDSEKKVSQLETLLKLVDGLRQGSFVPLSQQPPIRALLLPIGGLGWTALLDYRLLPGL